MKITKYPQSCFVIESAGKKIMIDPGSFFAEKFSARNFLDVSAVLLTHQHIDHLDLASTKLFVENEIPIYGNADVAAKLKSENVAVLEVSDRKKFSIAGFEIEPVDLPHAKALFCEDCNEIVTYRVGTPNRRCAKHSDKIPKQINAGPQNTGFLINNTLFHPGDGIELSNFKAKNVAIPITGPSIDYSDAWNFVRSLGAKVVIPIHYDLPRLLPEIRDPYAFAKLNPGNVEVRILNDGESTEIK